PSTLTHTSASPSLSHTPPTPETSTFPYTTLFRSLLAQPVGPDHASDDRHGQREHDDLVDPGHDGRDRQRQLDAPEDLTAGGTEGDRKSTRLNSSHVSISYAVFCLKKKTTQNTMTQ